MPVLSEYSLSGQLLSLPPPAATKLPSWPKRYPRPGRPYLSLPAIDRNWTRCYRPCLQPVPALFCLQPPPILRPG